MNISKNTLIFGVVLLGVIIVIAGGVWFASLFVTEDGSGGGTEGLFSSLFPFGFGGEGQAVGTTPDGNGESETEAGPVPELREVTRNPVSGAYFQTNGKLRYVERETGHVFETATDSLGVARLSNTTIPGIERIIRVDDERMIMQYADESDTLRNYLTKIASSTEDQLLQGVFLPSFIDAFPTEKVDELLTISKNAGGTRIEVIDIDGPARTLLYSSPLRAWTLLKGVDDIFLARLPSSAAGIVYRVGTNQSLEKIIGWRPQMTAVINTLGTAFVLSAETEGQTRLTAYDTKAGEVYPLPFSTFAEKCAWFPEGVVVSSLFCGAPSSLDITLEEWHMGAGETNDIAWVVNPITGIATVVSYLGQSAGRPIDVINPMVSPDGQYAVFTNKNDLSLWSLRLSN